ncbi:hypothetical protein N8I77_011243 [Diaporthe amygdali]|uniref:Major facilitator superfamily (MFS) profile domain-containing protein n=1 Tax=Phomopsis amygdali TaxID=1214568 RepID=A0AAD9S561_PHOAM|nr:hypothetical protein N8I77_011243 [Diaporthe amygdali]
MAQPNEKSASITEKETTIQGLETWLSTTPVRVVVTETTSLSDKDEAFEFLQNNPRRDELLQEGRDILDDPVKSRKLLRKIDLTIIPLLALTYFLQALDKVALEYTAVMGIREDTHLVGQQYSYLGMLFWVGFLVLELPTQMLAQHVSRLGLYLGVNIILWGITVVCHAACTNFAGLAVVRSLLGAFESCVAPILVLIIAMWYKKSEQGRRVSWHHVMANVSTIVGGSVSYGCSFIKSRFAVWRTFYLIIGLLTIFAGLIVCLFLPDSPVRARRFTEAEKAAVLLRIRDNQSGTQNAKIKKPQVIQALKDGRVLLVAFIVLLMAVHAGGFSTFGTILTVSFGFTRQQALILTVPMGFIGLFVVLLVGWLSDKLNDRSTILIIGTIPSILSLSLMIALDPHGRPLNKAGLLAARLIGITGSSCLQVMFAWNASNISGHTKKVTANALTLMFYATGNILGTQAFRDTEAPAYTSGKITIIACLSTTCFLVFILRRWNIKLNKKNSKTLAGFSEAENEDLRTKLAFGDTPDRQNPFFVYTR